MSHHRIRALVRLLAIAGGIAALALGGGAWAADPADGQAVYKSQCSICHTVAPGRNSIGPTLFGVVGRKTGSAPGFHYSPANIRANITWEPATLDKYIETPRAVVPGTIMTYSGVKDATKRADLIAYLETLR